MKKVTFSGEARTERHFSALLLPHLLMSSNFAGFRALFEELKLCEGEEFDADDIEIVAELNPIRDIAARTDEFEHEEALSERQGQVVSDLFLRMGDSALVIEAKFFTHPSASKVADQLKAQREAIEKVLPRTQYNGCRFHYLALTVEELVDLGDGDTNSNMKSITWSRVISVLKPVVDVDGGRDTVYALGKLEDAVERAKKRPAREEGRCRSINELLEKAPWLLEEGYRYIGFKGGEGALANATVKDMENRDHYKYSSRKSKNWVPLHSVISHYLKKKTAV